VKGEIVFLFLWKIWALQTLNYLWIELITMGIIFQKIADELHKLFKTQIKVLIYFSLTIMKLRL